HTALNAILGGTRWQTGNIDDLGTQSVDLRNMSVKEAIYELLNIFDGERRTRVEVDGNLITRRYIDIYRNRGDNTGKRFEVGKDILSTQRTLDSSGIKTALYGFGASGENDKPRLTFADVEWSISNGDPMDKPLGQTWIGDPIALQQYGYAQGTRHRFGSYDGQESDPAELLLNTYRELQKLTKLNETYDFNVIQLAELLDAEHEKVRIGDRTYSINNDIHPSVQVENSVIEYRQNLNDRKLSEVTLGDFRSAYDLSSRFNRVEKDVNDKQGNWDSKPDVDDVEDMVEDGNKWVQDALDDVQDEIDRATQELEDAMIDLDDAMSAADTVFTNKIKSSHNYKGYFSGDVGITGQLHVAGEIYAGSGATFRGTINANNLNLDNANIRNANIRDANITGTLNGVDGNFVGTVLANQIIGNEIAGVTLKTANLINYIHLRNQILEFWNQDLRKMELGFELWQGESSQSPYIQLGAGDSSNRNRVYMTKREDRFDLAYITSNS